MMLNVSETETVRDRDIGLVRMEYYSIGLIHAILKLGCHFE